MTLYSPLYPDIATLGIDDLVTFDQASDLMPSTKAWRAWMPVTGNWYASWTGANCAEFHLALVSEDGKLSIQGSVVVGRSPSTLSPDKLKKAVAKLMAKSEAVSAST